MDNPADGAAGEARHVGIWDRRTDRVTVLAETAERAEEIDVSRAEAALARAEKRLASNDTNIDWDRAAVALQRAVIRIQIVRKYRGAPVATP